LPAMKLLSIAILLALAPTAFADTPFAVLAKPKTTWTYDVVTGKKHKATSAKATITVTAVHVVGPYTVIEIDTTIVPPSDALSIQPSTWIVGPGGLHEVLFFDPTADGGYSVDHVASAYADHYVPRAYLQATPAEKSKLHWKLGRFGDEDRDYNVKGAITRPDARTWRTAWTGSYTIPENGEKSKYVWSTDFDPAVGFTQICTENSFCMRLHKPAP
jgi:hypothetical protein